MTKKLAIGTIILSIILIVAGCSTPAASSVPDENPAQNQQATPPPANISTPPPPPAASNPKPAGMIKAKWIEPKINGNTASIPVDEVTNSWNTVFNVNTQGSTLHYMAYNLDGKLYVRASTCPPCRGITYSLNNDILVCDTCGTTFKAKTGEGIRGACVNYPKAEVPYKIVDDNIVMDGTDMIKAYQETLKAG